MTCRYGEAKEGPLESGKNPLDLTSEPYLALAKLGVTLLSSIIITTVYYFAINYLNASILSYPRIN
jgi:hypothetical protein